MENLKEKIYIVKRRIKGLGNTLISIICSIYPINQKKIAVCTFEGRNGFCCNPRYIVEELHKRDNSYQFVWIVDDMSKEFPDYIKKVPNTIWSRNFHLATSKLWIDNYRHPLGTRKRKNQFYIETWHGGIGFKNIGLWRGESFSPIAYMVSKHDSDMIDCVITESKWSEYLFRKGLIYDGKYCLTGSARCTTLYGDKEKYRIALRERFGLPQDAKIVLYAPTFREESVGGVRKVSVGEWGIDFERLLAGLNKRFGGEWYLAVRVHPQLAKAFDDYKNDLLAGRIINVSKEDDLYQILPAFDATVSDYSSVVIEAMYGDMPTFIFADDLDEYENSRGGMYWRFPSNHLGDIEVDQIIMPGTRVVLPCHYSRTNEELEEDITSFDEKEYKKRVLAFREAMGIRFDGHADEYAADLAEEYLNK